MIIELEGNREDSLRKISELAEKYGNTLERIQGRGPVDTLHVIGDPKGLAQHMEYLETIPGVGRVWRISSSYKNIARRVASEGQRSVMRESRIVEIPGPDGKVRRFGGEETVFIVGPDSVQTEEQVFEAGRKIAALADKLDIRHRVMLRAGAFKPRTRPTDFRGMGLDGIKLLDKVREETGIPYVSEVMDHTLVEELAEHLDCFQIGTRNAQDFKLLETVGDTGKPVILKRGFGNDAVEWFNAAEYIANRQNLNIMMCERGVKTMYCGNGYNRFTPDLNVITYAREQTVLPVIYDPSHAAGDDRLVVPNMLAALPYRPAALLVETIHEESFRSEQLCDAKQALAMDPLEHAIRAVMDFEKVILPHLSNAQHYFSHRPS
ncbi:MAG TPA: 3-deoxy-D-arabino-heptulosonate 7-phosphate synthase [Phycisphaerales bacterium]|nr:3-deoxy-D-arabino-heptulosonate 7-phosphate synthase [Phycisphaerales bacterium]